MTTEATDDWCMQYGMSLKTRSLEWTDGSRLAPVAKYRVEPIAQAGQFPHGNSTGPVWKFSGLPLGLLLPLLL